MRGWLVVLVGCGSRVAIYQPGDDGWDAYELPQSDGECASDRDCTENGCGNHCTSTEVPSFIGTCEYAGHNDYATCGCVDDACQWYAGPLTIRGGA